MLRRALPRRRHHALLHRRCGAGARRRSICGFHLSFGGVLTFPKAEAFREAARITPDDRLLVETDCPYLAPVPHRGKRNEPAFVVETARRLAEVRGDHAGGDRGTAPRATFERLCLRVQPRTGKLVNLHEFRQAGAGPHRQRDFRPHPGRPGAGRKEASPRNRWRRWTPSPPSGSTCNRAAANGCVPRCCCSPRSWSGDGRPDGDPAGRRGGDDPRRHAGARRRDRRRRDAPRPSFDQRQVGQSHLRAGRRLALHAGLPDRAARAQLPDSRPADRRSPR